MNVYDLTTPALIVDADAFATNVATMAAAHPGPALRPHVKAFKATALARELVAAGHETFCCATPREVEGMASVGLGTDLLLANEVVDGRRLGRMAAATIGARVTVAVDSPETIAAAAAAGVREVLVDVAVGLPRGGCRPEDAGALAEQAGQAGLGVRGVMGYEGHLMMEVDDQEAAVEAAMAQLLRAHGDVGGDVVSGGGTGTYAVNRWVTEIQAGSYTLMDTQYASRDLPFQLALAIWSTVISVDVGGRWAVCDAGLKSMSMDHGNPTVEGGVVWFCSDEHTTFSAAESRTLPCVGERIRIWPAHVDPTVAVHDTLHVVRDEEILTSWEIDLRGW